MILARSDQLIKSNMGKVLLTVGVGPFQSLVALGNVWVTKTIYGMPGVTLSHTWEIVQWQEHWNDYRFIDLKRSFGTCLSLHADYCVKIFAELIFVLPLPFYSVDLISIDYCVPVCYRKNFSNTCWSLSSKKPLWAIGLASKYLQAHIQYLHILWILIKSVWTHGHSRLRC